MQKTLDIEMVRVLTQPVVPKALHYINPRKIMGEAKWKKLRKEYQIKADHHCMICKEYVKHVPGDWLELHEKYDYDFDKLIQRLTGYISICHSCHAYIHEGLLNVQLRKGEVTESYVQAILDRGDNLLREFNLEKIQYPNRKIFENPDWQLEFDGNFYSKKSTD
ncbi:hypothetical protein ACFFRT_12920 [Enterococcus thailandicus]|uniref:HNH endonuclease n=1 Tax=Enterococcus thailandicus TaxID=417368 RepID=A0A510WGT8_ENTTH|nr:hypothetical protein [Enterococcus thailandicus]MDT2750433.1 hypothetical protein [Enterococcus thailandicus]MDT2774994.1 hypothetical protein [Enterococcus thailandicus]GEK38296.1 hypothetical protein ETH01_25830 [Enterococcus thailandicus]